MSDPTDQASDLEEEQRTAAIQRHINRHRDTPATNARGRVCLDCSKRIRAKRLLAHPNAVRCIEHARRHEQRLKHFKAL